MEDHSNSSSYAGATLSSRHTLYSRRYDDSIDAAEAALLEASVFSGSGNNNRSKTVCFADNSNMTIQDIYSHNSQESVPFDVLQSPYRIDQSPAVAAPPPLDFRRTPNHAQAWESDGDFPIKEIERIKKKTRRLRSLRQEGTDPGDVQPTTDDGFSTELAPDSFRDKTTPRRTFAGSRAQTTTAPPRPTPYHRVQPQPWSREFARMNRKPMIASTRF